MGKYVLKQGRTGVKFNLEAGNGVVIAVSQVYASKDSCKKGIESLKNNANSVIEDQTVRDYKEESNPKFEVYQDKKREYRFRLVSRNGKIIVASEGYTSLQACKNGIDSIRRNADSPIVEED